MRMPTPTRLSSLSDQQAEAYINQAKERFKNEQFPGIWHFLAFAAILTVGAAIAIFVPDLPRWLEYPLMIACGIAVGRGFWTMQGRKLDHYLADILRNEGRCTCCGYDLSGADHERCPECGTPVETDRPPATPAIDPPTTVNRTTNRPV